MVSPQRFVRFVALNLNGVRNGHAIGKLLNTARINAGKSHE
jgi:hypothetical protein